MKTIKRLSILTIFLGLVFLNTNCSKKITVVWEGNIYNGTKPFVGVSVSLSSCYGGGDKASYECISSNSVGSCLTDNNGHFRISGSASSGNLFLPSLYKDSGNSIVNSRNSQKPIGLDELKGSRYTDIHF